MAEGNLLRVIAVVAMVVTVLGVAVVILAFHATLTFEVSLIYHVQVGSVSLLYVQK